MRKGVGILVQFALSCIGIIFIGALPVLTKGLNSGILDWSGYIHSLSTIINGLFHPDQLKYFTVTPFSSIERPLFPTLLNPVFYSLTILFSSLVVATIGALLFTIFTLLIPVRIRQGVKMTLNILESIPDILVIILAQFFVIFFFQKTGVLLVDVAALTGQKVYFLPIICLAILPTIQLYRLSMLTFEDEEEKNYVLLARSIGLGKMAVIVIHMFRNAIISVFFQSKKTVWFMLSNLFILEWLFNISGITRFLFANMDPQIFTIALIMFFIPIFLFYTLGEWILSSKANRGESLS